MGDWSVGRIAIAIIIIAAVTAVVYVALGALGIAIPSVVVNLLWIIVVATICVGAVLLLIKLWNKTP